MTFLILGYNDHGKDNARMLRWVILICHKENLKLNKGKCYLRDMRVPLFGEIISRCGVQLNPHKFCTLTDRPHTTNKHSSFASFHHWEKLDRLSGFQCMAIQLDRLSFFPCMVIWLNVHFQGSCGQGWCLIRETAQPVTLTSCPASMCIVNYTGLSHSLYKASTE